MNLHFSGFLKPYFLHIHNGKWFWDFAFMQNFDNQEFIISNYRITNIRSVY
jgi:hypothetical protein